MSIFDLRVLVVDDTKDMTDAITSYCDTEKDLDCHVINNGQEALERIRKEKFDLILLDLSIPEFSGMGRSHITETRRTIRIKKYCYLYRIIGSTHAEGYKRCWCERVIQKALFVKCLGRIDREISSSP